MGQFEFPSTAALARIKSEGLSSTGVESVAEKAVTLGGMIFDVIGFKGVSTGTAFFTYLKNLAADKDEANLVYFGDALVDDIRRLYRLYGELKQQFDKRIESPEFSTAVANATLYITRTNVESRLKRLAHLISNGVKADDLEPENLDDMMRAAVELTDWDIVVLGRMYESQKQFLTNRNFSHDWSTNVGNVWTNWNKIFSLGEDQHLKLRSAISRLLSAGFVAEAQTNFVKDGSLARQAFGLLPEGKKFYDRLEEIGKTK